jgi:uncharacterized protein (TIGR03435 family)
LHNRIDSIAAMLAFTIASGWLLAQNNVPLQFEAATIRLNKGPGMGQGAEDVSVADGRVRIINIPLRMLIRVAALGPRDTRPIIGPPVLDSVRVDVIAKASSPNASIDELRAMVVDLLKDRMKLVSHFEARDMPAYALVRLRAEPKLKEMPGEPGQCQLRQEQADAGISGPPQRSNSVHWDCQNVSMTQLASRLTDHVDRPVVDQTGIAGARTFSFDWAFEPDSEGASMARSLSGLGLGLKPAKLPVPVLVVDSIASSPSE